MGNRFPISLMLVLIPYDAFALHEIAGLYKDSRGIQVELVGSDESYSLTIEDVTERAKNKAGTGLSYCLMFDFLDVLIPERLVGDSTFECLGSKVTVDGYHDEVLIQGKRLENVYRLVVEREGWVAVETGIFKRPGGRGVFELYFSLSEGLIGFEVDQVVFFRQ